LFKLSISDVIYQCYDLEYARQGSLYDFIRKAEEPNSFKQILQWAKEVALGEHI